MKWQGRGRGARAAAVRRGAMGIALSDEAEGMGVSLLVSRAGRKSDDGGTHRPSKGVVRLV